MNKIVFSFFSLIVFSFQIKCMDQERMALPTSNNSSLNENRSQSLELQIKELQKQHEFAMEEERQKSLGHPQYRTSSLSTLPQSFKITDHNNNFIESKKSPTAPTRKNRHQRQRSSSDTQLAQLVATQQLALNRPPQYTIINSSQSVDELLKYSNDRLMEAVSGFTLLTEQIQSNLIEATETYRTQTSTMLTTQNKKKKNGFVDSMKRKGNRLIGINTDEKQLEKQMKKNAKQTLEAKQALTPLLVRIETIVQKVEEMQKKVETATLRVKGKQERIKENREVSSSSSQQHKAQQFHRPTIIISDQLSRKINTRSDYEA